MRHYFLQKDIDDLTDQIRESRVENSAKRTNPQEMTEINHLKQEIATINTVLLAGELTAKKLDLLAEVMQRLENRTK